jgi:hypothetical protein
VQLFAIKSDLEVADIFTKGLARGPFDNAEDKLGLRNIFTPACGGVLKKKDHDPHDLTELLKEIEEEQVLRRERPDGNYEKSLSITK